MKERMTRRGLFTRLLGMLASIPFLGKLGAATDKLGAAISPDWPQACIHGKPVDGPWCEDCRQVGLCAVWVEEAEIIPSWLIELNALSHERFILEQRGRGERQPPLTEADYERGHWIMLRMEELAPKSPPLTQQVMNNGILVKTPEQLKRLAVGELRSIITS